MRLKRNMKAYTEQDYEHINKCLLSEGLTKEQMTFETDNTYLTEKGFFSYRIENEYPRLVHFYINKKDRSFKAAQDLMRIFHKILINEEHLFFIVDAPKESPYIKRIIKYIKGKKYLELNGDSFYYVPVFGRF